MIAQKMISKKYLKNDCITESKRSKKESQENISFLKVIFLI